MKGATRSLLDALDADQRAALERAPLPQWTAPMLATLTDQPFSSKDWIYERKLDGVRCLAFRDGRSVRLYSRNRQPLERTYPELVDALGAVTPRRFVVDGEIVAFDRGRSSFARLQQRLGISDPAAARASPVRVHLYLFDLMHLDDARLERLPLRLRKRLLRDAFDLAEPLRFSAHRNGDGEAFFADACRKGWEGIIAKRADSRYVHLRSRDWLKFKCSNRQELVIGGYTEPKGSRSGFGAVLVGFYDKGALRYAGKVGTGFDAATLEELKRKFDRRRRASSPFANPPREKAQWIAPELVAEIAFTEWTRDARLRHPRFIGLRSDKPARAVRRERAAHA